MSKKFIAEPWAEIQFDAKDRNAIKHVKRELFWLLERNRKDFDTVTCPCPIRQTLFPGEEPHKITIKQSASGGVRIACEWHHNSRAVLFAIVDRLRECG